MKIYTGFPELARALQKKTTILAVDTIYQVRAIKNKYAGFENYWDMPFDLVAESEIIFIKNNQMFYPNIGYCVETKEYCMVYTCLWYYDNLVLLEKYVLDKNKPNIKSKNPYQQIKSNKFRFVGQQ